ncbi:hypothetical protein VKT23_012951 [Stygiomarasmius scandens]|uniref:Uncharacterized protein n=1 Tax=Marasmiellus scandens TaxID=2682957 RepID=A0ABR1J869_9AGAR
MHPQILVWLILLGLALAKLQNFTIDDNVNHANQTLNGAFITYSPPHLWQLGNTCGGCAAHPDSGKAHNGTWHDSTFYPPSEKSPIGVPNQPLNATVTFNGTSIYVFCILANAETKPDGDSDMLFFIDGENTKNFTMGAPGTSGYEYNVPVYVNEDLSPGFHDLKIQNGHVNGIKSLVLLDYIVFTSDDGTSGSPDTQEDSGSSPKNLGKIVGPVVTVAMLLLVGGAGFLIWRHHRLRDVHRGNVVIPYTLGQRHTPTAPKSSQTYNNQDRHARDMFPPAYEGPTTLNAPTRSK